MSSPSSTPAAKSRLILCIDSADIGLRVEKLLLGGEGYRVLTANSAEEALDIFRLNPIELVIADHFVRGTSGSEIVREMQELKPEVPILFIPAA